MLMCAGTVPANNKFDLHSFTDFTIIIVPSDKVLTEKPSLALAVLSGFLRLISAVPFCDVC